MDDRNAYRLMEPLRTDDGPVPTPRYDVRAAMRTGRRRATIRAAAAGIVAAVLVAAAVTVPVILASHRPPALPAPPGPAPSCVAGAWPPPSGMPGYTYVSRVHMDPTGRYEVATFLATNDVGKSLARSALWRDMAGMVLPVGLGSVGAVAVNSSGVVVGGGQPDTPTLPYERPWIFFDYPGGGSYKELLGTPPVPEVSPRGIDDAGNVYGSSPGGLVFWPAGALGSPQVIPDSAGSGIGGVTPDGTILGDTVADPTRGVPARWQRTGTTWTRQVLATGPGRTGTATAEAGGLIVGYLIQDGTFHAALWRSADVAPDIVGAPGDVLTGISAGGIAVGTRSDTAGRSEPVSYDGGTVEILPPPPTGDGTAARSRVARAISTDGHVIVGGSGLAVDVWFCGGPHGGRNPPDPTGTG